MKTKKSLFVMAAMAIVFAVSSCGSQEKKSTTTTPKTEEVAAKKAYQCPMKCEGEKSYDKSGTCPVCEMDLAELKATK